MTFWLAAPLPNRKSPGSVSESGGNGLRAIASLRRFLEGNLTRLHHDPCLKPQPWSLISNYVGTLGQTDLTRQANIPA
jgi:hypothetical protein